MVRRGKDSGRFAIPSTRVVDGANQVGRRGPHFGPHDRLLRGIVTSGKKVKILAAGARLATRGTLRLLRCDPDGNGSVGLLLVWFKHGRKLDQGTVVNSLSGWYQPKGQQNVVAIEIELRVGTVPIRSCARQAKESKILGPLEHGLHVNDGFGHKI